MAVKFNIKRTGKYDKLRLSISKGRGKQIILSTQYQCPPGKFNTSTQQLKGTGDHIQAFNQEIFLILQNVKSVLRALSDDASLDEIKEIAKNILQTPVVKFSVGRRPLPSPVKRVKVNYRDSDTNIISALRKYIEDNKTVHKPETARKYEILITIIEQANLHYTDIRDLSTKWCIKFRDHLINKRNQNNDTIQKNFRALKAALRDQKKINPELLAFKLDLKTSSNRRLEVLALTETEINKLKSTDLIPHQERIRDLFLFQLYTCQRISDVIQFHKDQIFKIDKGYVWEFISIKTGKLTKVPLYGITKEAYEILLKYNFELPIVVEQYLNREIKKIAKIAELNRIKILTRHKGNRRIETKKYVYELISSHSARRSGITRLLNNGIPLNIVQMISQHSDIKTLMKYVENEDEALFNSF